MIGVGVVEGDGVHGDEAGMNGVGVRMEGVEWG